MEPIPETRRYDVVDCLDRASDPAAVDAVERVGPSDVAAADRLSFARNVFVPLTTACRYTCTYCTYYDPPGRAELMSPDDVRAVVRRGARAGCTEALFTFGDDPDDRYDAIHDQLAAWGYDSVHEYLRRSCEIALAEGLLPHSNPGDQTREQMATVADVNASMGVMLETTADVRAHGGPRAKSPGQRLHTIRTAGELGVPFTTGILVGIGEDRRDRARSLLAIADLHERYGHVQEVLVQPVVENERWQGGTPDLATLRHATAMARYALPDDVSVQVPPNLAPVRDLLDCGVDDLGGVSPVTDDHINPAHEWPAVRELASVADEAGVSLSERLPVYRRFLPEDLARVDGAGADADGTGTGTGTGRASAATVTDGGTDDREWVSERVRAAIAADDEAGRRFRAVLSAPGGRG